MLDPSNAIFRAAMKSSLGRRIFTDTNRSTTLPPSNMNVPTVAGILLDKTILFGTRRHTTESKQTWSKEDCETFGNGKRRKRSEEEKKRHSGKRLVGANSQRRKNSKPNQNLHSGASLKIPGAAATVAAKTSSGLHHMGVRFVAIRGA